MRFSKHALAAAVAIGAITAPASAQQSGPVAVYWVSAATTSGGMGGAMGGYGSGMATTSDTPPTPAPPKPAKPKRAGFGSMIGAIAGAATGLPIPGAASSGGYEQPSEPSGGGYSGQGGYNPYGGRGAQAMRTLTLQLGSTQTAPAGPQADHMIPPGMSMGASLPLMTPVRTAPEPTPDGIPPEYRNQQPRGKMIIYWGCGEHATAAPIVIDFAKLGQGKAPPFPMIQVNVQQPPSPSRYATYGEWPNERDGRPIPANATLVGAHAVQGNYSPAISFSLGAGNDFMAPLRVANAPSTDGGVRLSWYAIPNATGYFAWMMGSTGGNDGAVIMWSSSGVANAFSALMDYLPPSEVRRLIGTRAVMSPTTTECIVPAEVIKASPIGMVSMIAYGDEVNTAFPPRPTDPKAAWHLKYTVKVRYKSTGSAILGMPSM